MQIVVLGTSTDAILLASRLCKQHDIVLVDVDAKEKASYNKLDVVAIDGMVIDVAVLDEANVAGADVVCALSSVENLNLVAAQICKKKYGVKKVITCIYDTDDYGIYEDAGVFPISATDLTVDAFIQHIMDDKSLTTGQLGVAQASLFGNNYKFKLFRIDKNLAGSKIKKIVDTEGGVILGIIRDGVLTQYDPNFKVQEFDKVLIAEMFE
ncbi:MAG: NAD-binding protein [Clostridia bacterium]|nr:NAD-binding protein [Clostridia bacterium]